MASVVHRDTCDTPVKCTADGLAKFGSARPCKAMEPEMRLYGTTQWCVEYLINVQQTRTTPTILVSCHPSIFHNRRCMLMTKPVHIWALCRWPLGYIFSSQFPCFLCIELHQDAVLSDHSTASDEKSVTKCIPRRLKSHPNARNIKCTFLLAIPPMVTCHKFRQFIYKNMVCLLCNSSCSISSHSQ